MAEKFKVTIVFRCLGCNKQTEHNMDMSKYPEVKVKNTTMLESIVQFMVGWISERHFRVYYDYLAMQNCTGNGETVYKPSVSPDLFFRPTFIEHIYIESRDTRIIEHINEVETEVIKALEIKSSGPYVYATN